MVVTLLSLYSLFSKYINMYNRYFSNRCNAKKDGCKVTSKHVDSLLLCPKFIEYCYFPLTGYSCFLPCKNGSIYVCSDTLWGLLKDVRKLYLSSYYYVNTSLIPLFKFRLKK